MTAEHLIGREYKVTVTETTTYTIENTDVTDWESPDDVLDHFKTHGAWGAQEINASVGYQVEDTETGQRVSYSR